MPRKVSTQPAPSLGKRKRSNEAASEALSEGKRGRAQLDGGQQRLDSNFDDCDSDDESDYEDEHGHVDAVLDDFEVLINRADEELDDNDSLLFSEEGDEELE